MTEDDPADLTTAADRPFPLLSIGTTGWWRTAAIVLVGMVAAVSLSGPSAARDATLTAAARVSRETHEGATLATSALRAAVIQARAQRGANDAPALLVVPSLVRPRMALELGLSLTEVDPISDFGAVDLAKGYPAPGQIVLYQQVADPGRLAAELGVTTSTEIDGVVLDPVFVDPTSGTWVVAIRRP
jgi:hypothetical protein